MRRGLGLSKTAPVAKGEEQLMREVGVSGMASSVSPSKSCITISKASMPYTMERCAEE
jgi:hypothetical protein